MKHTRTFTRRWPLCGLLALCLLFALSPVSRADSPAAWQAADAVQKALSRAQVALYGSAPDDAAKAVDEATQTYAAQLAPLAQTDAAAAVALGTNALAQADSAAQSNNQTGFASASATMQTALYQIGYAETLAALRRGDADAASQWLLLRAFRQVTRFERLNSNSTQAITDFRTGKINSDAALAIVQTDLLDTYQARLDAALHDLRAADARSLAAGRAQNAAQAEGYFAILAPAYRTQRGDAALANAQQVFASLRQTAAAGNAVASLLPQTDEALRGFRAAPLSLAEQTRRAGQLLRFVALVPVEYARGAKDGQVTIALEIQEAATFRDGAEAAFNDVRSILDARDPQTTAQVAAAFAALEQQLLDARKQTKVAGSGEVQAAADHITALLQGVMPADWLKSDTGADFDVISAALDQMDRAVAAGQYDLAESARLEAYAIMEAGPEAKLLVFAPQMKQPIEDLFWYGQGEHTGLAALIERKATKAEISASRKALDAELVAAAQALIGNNAPEAIASTAALIVFREGLEAVLILASLLGSLKAASARPLRNSLWLGTVLAFAASVLTWLLARELLTTLARYGEKLEAVVSLVAIAVLLLITNWFFHDVYWTGWMAGFHRQKKQMIGGAGQLLGLVLLGFTSVYREGFETVLFLQALVLESTTTTVLAGIGAGLGLTLLIGLLVFVVQAKLPHRRMLIFTGILIGAVLLQMVGNTVHVLQVVGWLPIHPVTWLLPFFPYWTGLWFGLYATWEGLLLQLAAAVFTIGSYFLAERLQKRAAAAPATASL